MTAPKGNAPSTSALLLMDFESSVVQHLGDPATIAAASAALAHARERGVRVMFPRVRFRAGFPEVDPRNRTFGSIAERSAGPVPDKAYAIIGDLAPRSDEPVIDKRRVSAFAGSDLDVLLRASGITHLILGGITTSGVVLSTLRQAADLDYRITVLSDACHDPDPVIHDLLMERVFPQQADVVSIDAWTTLP